jgi:hypothetical protein
MQRKEAQAGRRRLHLMLPPDVHAPAAARRALRTLPLGERAGDVVLLASELVASAVGAAHAPDEPIELSASCNSGRTRVEVHDHGHGLAAGDLAGGYGLQVLSIASARWGIEHDRTTRVWFELDR